MTALTLYQSNDNNVTGSLIAKRVYSTSNAGSFTSHSTSVNSSTSTGFGEILSHGGGSSWAALGALGAASGHGLLLDDTSLEGQQIVAGNWSTIVRCNSSVGSLIGDIYIRYYIWNSVSLTYTAIGQGVLIGQTLTTTTTNYTVTATSLPIAAFHANDKLYIDIWFKINTNSQGGSIGTISWSGFSTTAGGGSATVNTSTPGYQVSPSVTFTGHGMLTASGQVQGMATLSGHGVLVASGQNQNAAKLIGHGAINASGRVQGLASLVGHGSLLASGQSQGRATLLGHGTLNGSAYSLARSLLIGHGLLNAAGQAIGAVTLIGHGVLTALYVPPPPLHFGPGILTTKLAAGAITKSQNTASGIVTSQNGVSGIGGTSRT